MLMMWGTVDIAVWALHTTENLHVGWAAAAAAYRHEGKDDHVSQGDYTGSQTAVENE